MKIVTLFYCWLWECRVHWEMNKEKNDQTMFLSFFLRSINLFFKRRRPNWLIYWTIVHIDHLLLKLILQCVQVCKLLLLLLAYGIHICGFPICFSFNHNFICRWAIHNRLLYNFIYQLIEGTNLLVIKRLMVNSI